MDDLDAAGETLQSLHGINARVEGPEGVDLEVEGASLLQLGVDGGAPGHDHELMAVVVVAQRDALLGQTELGLVHDGAEVDDLVQGGEIRAGDDVVGVADGLVEGDGGLDVLGKQLAPARVSATALQTVLVLPLLDLLGGVSEEARVLHVLVAHLGDGLERALQIVTGNVAQTEKLKSVFGCHG